MMAAEFPPVNLLVEGPTDEIVVRKLLEYVGLPSGKSYGLSGKPALLAKLPNYNQAAQWSPWLALVDLDQEPDCAPLLVQNELPNPARGMRFRVAVRAIEAWLLADKQNLARFLAVEATQFPDNPDIELNPKVSLVNLARQSTKRTIKEAIVPREGSGGLVGPEYTQKIREFVTVSSYRWQPDVAMLHSDSLRRCIEALQTLKEWTPN